jgi:preprotein translocase subunit SecD
MTVRSKIWIKFALAVVLFLVAALVAWPKPIQKPEFVGKFLSAFKMNLGLDLQGGIHLVYKVDTSGVEPAKLPDALSGLQDVIERRVNAFGVAEPVIEVAKSGNEQRLIVELAGIKDIDAAKQMIKETPFLEFKSMEMPAQEPTPPESSAEDQKYNDQQKQKAEDILKQIQGGADFSELAKQYSDDPGSKDKGGDLDFAKKGMFVPEFEQVIFDSGLQPGQIYPQIVETDFGYHIIKILEIRGDGEEKEVHSQHILLAKKTPPVSSQNPTFTETGISGKNLKNANVQFMSQSGKPEVGIEFDAEGTKIFSDLTKESIGKQIAIFLDGQVISAPTVQTQITDGKAVITGSFTLDEAKKLAQRLNEGALPLPLEGPIQQKSVDGTIGMSSFYVAIRAGIIGILLVMIFMILYYRFLGFIASIALVIYTSLMVAIFKISTVTPWAITLTLAGIAGFILSVGMAVDANILIFERTKEEIRKGRGMRSAIDEGFHRAWPSIRDSNISSIITSLILIWFGTGFVKGFAVTLLLGVLVSMFTAIVLVRTILSAIIGNWAENRAGWIVASTKKDISNE